MSQDFGSAASHPDSDPTRFAKRDFTKHGSQKVLGLSPVKSHAPVPTETSSATPGPH